jgi:processive 1,2-diacylglycerol beta-glucosyltransferase
LSPERPVLLLSAGALGVGPAAEAVRVLRHLRTPAQVVVICGKNEELLAETNRQVADAPGHLEFRVLGFTDTMDEWMTVADLYIGKPGGLTTAEALCKGLPMVILSPIPGQEERNSDHLLEEGVAIKCNDITILAYKLDRLLESPARLASMREAALRMSRPLAAQTIVRTLLEESRQLAPADVAVVGS